MKKNHLAGLIFLVLGAGLATGAWSTFAHIRSWLSTSATIQGEVTSLSQESSYDRKKHRTTHYYRPRVSFRTADGQRFTFESEVATSPPAYQVGEQVTVCYQPAHPADARIHSFIQLWLIPLILGFVGSIFLLTGVACCRVSTVKNSSLGAGFN